MGRSFRLLSEVIPKDGPFALGHQPGYEWWLTQRIAREQGGHDAFTPHIAPRHAGDPARIVASGAAAAADLGWTMRHSLTDMVASAWDDRRRH